MNRNKLTVGGLCSGIGGFSLAFQRAGFSAKWECELNVAARSVLNRHFSEARVYEDMTEFNPTVLDSVDILCGGTPCQGFSVAGLRNSLSDERSNLALRFVQLANKLDPAAILWENVPGVLSTRDNAFGCFLAGLVGADAPLVPTKECGGRWTNAGMVDGPKRSAAWRVLDAQFFGLAQRRNRVFVVSSPRKNLPFEVLFERKSLCGNSPPRREAKERIDPCLEGRAGSNGGNNFATSGGLVEVGECCSAHTKMDFETETFVTHPLRSEGCDASEDGTGRGTPLAVIPIQEFNKRHSGDSSNGVGHGKEGDPMFTLQASAQHAVAYRTAGNCGPFEQGDKTGALNTATDPSQNIVAFDTTQITSEANYSRPVPGDPCHPLAQSAHAPAVAFARRVRRLTPVECLRLMGLPDNWLDGLNLSDSAKYRMVGNAVAVPVVEWIARRLLQQLTSRNKSL